MSDLSDAWLHFSRCPVCSATTMDPFKRGTLHPQSLHASQIKITDSEYGKIWDLSRCRRCGHVFANPCPPEDLIRALYGGIEDPDYEEESRGRGKNFMGILDHLEDLTDEKGALFDVGAATGILMNLAERRGWEVDGIDPSRWAVRVARQKYGLPMREGPFESAALPAGRFTAVTLVDFIEHIPHPAVAMARVHEILKPGGIVCLVTPDITSLMARIAGGRWWHYRPAHLSYFTWDSLSRLLIRAGLRPIMLRRYAWTFSLYYLLSRKRIGHILLKNPYLTSFWQNIPLKLALYDSFEVYARKG